MTTSTPEQLVSQYLRRLRAELRDLPGDRRQELLDQINEHVAERLSEPGSQEPEKVRVMLIRLGDPAMLAAEARERFGIAPARRGSRESAVLLLGALSPLAILGLAAVFGHSSTVTGLLIPVLAVALLWLSRLWPLRDKLIGTGLLAVGATVLPVARTVVEDSSGLAFLGLVTAIIGPFVAATIYLGRQARRPAHY
jgi:uncharacterized membrane protein